MSDAILSVLESIMIVTALSMDALVASFAYGTNKIKIPFVSVTVINVVCSSILAVSILFGSLLSGVIPDAATHAICFSILFALGLTKLSESVIEAAVKKRGDIDKNVEFSLFKLRFKINVSPDREECVTSGGKVMTPYEAASLAVALSLDGLAVGFGAALADSNGVQIVAFSLISDMVAVMLGCFLGNKVAEKVSCNLSWLSGGLLLVLAFLKL